MNNALLHEKCLFVRKTLKLSQRALAGLIGSNQPEVSRIEQGFTPNPKRVSMIDLLYKKCLEKNDEQ